MVAVALDADIDQLSLQAGRIESAKRSQARRSLSGFLRYRFEAERRPLHWNWHLDYLCDLLEAQWLRQEELRFLLVNLPFRMLKSEVFGQTWQAWMIGKEDSARSSLLSAAASDSLVRRDSVKTRDMLLANWYQRIFPGIRLMKRTEEEWSTSGGAFRLAKGRGTVITGTGADHLLWDDILTPKEVASDKIRADTNFWLGDTFRSRLNDQITGTITGIQQRLHEEDPTGYLKAKMKNPDADQYYHVVLPNEAPQRTIVSFRDVVYAVREQGDLLHEKRFDRKATKAFWALNPVTAPGQLQQTPSRMEGGELKRAWLQYIDQPMEQIIRENGLRVNFYIDLASKKKEVQKDDPDYSVIAVMARDRWDRIHLLEVWRAQERSDGLCRQIIAMRKKYQKLGCMGRVKAEKGALANGLEGTMAEVLRNLREPGFIIEPISAPGDKVQRAQPLRYLAREKRLYLPRSGTWLPDFESEWGSFPNGVHDDQIDACAYGAIDLENMMPGKPPAKHPNMPGTITGDVLAAMSAKQKAIRDAAKEAGGGWWEARGSYLMPPEEGLRVAA